jgi:phosphatidylinositol glycan class K
MPCRGANYSYHPLLKYFILCSIVSIARAVNHAVLIDTSRLWSNYRHTSNILSFYNLLRHLGFSDRRITMFLTGDVPCHPSNSESGEVYHTRGHNLYASADSDVKGDEISKERIARLLSGKHSRWSPRDVRIVPGNDSRVLIFLTGHSGVGFAKIQDGEEFFAVDFADTLHEMFETGMYKELMWIGDTCRAASLHNQFYSKNIVSIGSSQEKQSSYSRHGDPKLGVNIVDRFSFNSELFLNASLRHRSNISLDVKDFVSLFNHEILLSDASFRTDLIESKSFPRRMIDFFGQAARLSMRHHYLGSFERNVPTAFMSAPQTDAVVIDIYKANANVHQPAFAVKTASAGQKPFMWNSIHLVTFAFFLSLIIFLIP